MKIFFHESNISKISQFNTLCHINSTVKGRLKAGNLRNLGDLGIFFECFWVRVFVKLKTRK